MFSPAPCGVASINILPDNTNTGMLLLNYPTCRRSVSRNLTVNYTALYKGILLNYPTLYQISRNLSQLYRSVSRYITKLSHSLLTAGMLVNYTGLDQEMLISQLHGGSVSRNATELSCWDVGQLYDLCRIILLSTIVEGLKYHS